MLGTRNRLASVQEVLLDLAEVEHDVLVLRGGQTRAVLEVGGVNLALLGPDEQQALLDGYRAWLNALDAPIQIVRLARPRDVERYLDDLRRRQPAEMPEALSRLLIDHVGFVRALAVQRNLMQHRFFVVVAGPSLEATASRALPRFWRARRARQSGAADELAAASRALDARARELGEGLHGLGLQARRLVGQDLLATLGLFLVPGQAVRQPLDGLPLLPVVRAEPGEARHSNGTARHPAGPPSVEFARGALGAVDLLAPAAVEVSASHLRVDDEYVRTLAVVDYPRFVRPGWLRPLHAFEEPLVSVQHFYPQESGRVVQALSRTLVQLQSSRLRDARGGRIADAEREVAYADVERLREQLERGEERVFSVGHYISVRAQTPDGLESRTRRVETLLGGLMARTRRCSLQQTAGFRASVPWGRDPLLRVRNLDTSSVASLFPFDVADVSTDRGVLLGVTKQGGGPVILDLFSGRLENASLVIFAKSGAGKSYAVKLLVLRGALLGQEAVIIDPEGEYVPLCRALDGQEVRLGASTPHTLNPFELEAAEPDPEDGTDRLAERSAWLLGLLDLMLSDVGASLSRPEAAALDRAIQTAYQARGITPDPTTYGRTPPTLADLYAALGEQGNPHGLADRLGRFVSGSLRHVFGGPTNVDLSRGLVVFNLRDLQDELRPLATSLVADFVWRRVRSGPPRPRLLVAEEAWSVARHPAGADLLLTLAKRGRKHWLGLVTVTQDVEDLLGSPQGRAVVANASARLLLKQDASSIDAVAATFKLTEGERQELLAARRGEALLCALGTRALVRVEAGPREHALITTNPAELAGAALAGQELPL